MVKKIYAIYGAGGYGNEVMALLRQNYKTNNDIKFCYIDDNPKYKKIIDIDCISFDQFLLDFKNYKKFCSIAIAKPSIKKNIYYKCMQNNIEIINIISQNSVLLSDYNFDKGVILNPFVTITTNIKIGLCFHANLYSYVAHDCIIGNFVTFAPSVKCNGNVIIEDEVYIGTGAIIYPGTKNKPLVIGKHSTVAAGQIVRKSIPPGTLYYKK